MDGLILSINNDFLIKLKSNGFNIKSLKCRVISQPTRNNIKFIKYNSLEIYNSLVTPIINSANILANTGEFFIINDIELESTNLKFLNNYRVTNIFDSLNIKKSIEFNSFQSYNWNAASDKYATFIIELINEYIVNINLAVPTRLNLNLYADSGYVDSNYFI